jgi:N-glycosylase/DNA lyase
MKDALDFYGKNRKKIDAFLEKARQKKKEEIRFELYFCLLTPQSKAPLCRTALEEMHKKGIIFDAGSEKLLTYMGCVRFNKNKSRYIVEARDKFDEIFSKIEELREKPLALREWLVKNVKGYGHKEASHFLRNIGLGEELAILDRHILRRMKIEEKALTKKKYLEYEKKFRNLAKKHGLKSAELDIAIWLNDSGSQEIM